MSEEQAYEAGYKAGATHYELEHCPACRNVADLQAALAENARLRELVVALYRVHFDTEVESWDAWFRPCGTCEERNGGVAPCALTAEDMTDVYCDPITREIFTSRMRELGIEVDG